MKKTFLVILILSFSFLFLFSPVQAKVNWPWQVRQEIREEAREQLNLTGTPSARPTAKEVRKEIRQELVGQIKEKLQWLLPFGFNQVGLKAISGNDLTVSKDDKTYTVKVTEKTNLLRKFGGKSSLAEFSVGDILSVRGKWTDETKTILEARVIRNLSVQKRKGTFLGTIKSKGDNSFILAAANRGDQAVHLSGDTKIVNRMNVTVIFADLKLGDRVRVSGLWDNKLNTITEVSRIKDWSIPPKVTPTP